MEDKTNCVHEYSRTIDQPYPRHCTKCGEIEDSPIPPEIQIKINKGINAAYEEMQADLLIEAKKAAEVKYPILNRGNYILNEFMSINSINEPKGVLQYDNDWNLLMAVVEKIEKMDTGRVGYYYNVRIAQGMVNVEGGLMKVISRNVSHEGNKRTALFLALVDFVEWLTMEGYITAEKDKLTDLEEAFNAGSENQHMTFEQWYNKT